MQDQIVSVILRLAIFRLRNLLASFLSHLPIHSTDPDSLYLLIVKESKQNTYLSSLMTVIYKHHERRMQKGGMDQTKIKCLAELETKAIILQLVNEKLQYIKREAENVQAEANEDNSAQLTAKNKDSTSLQAIANKWPNQIQSSISEQEQVHPHEEISCFEQSKEQGHFLFGDKAQQIEQIFSIEEELYGLVRWQSRWGGEIPRSSVLNIATIKQHAPRFLCTFLESFMRRLNS